VQAFPGAADLLKALHGRGIRIALASSAKAEELQHYVRLLGVGTILSSITSSDEVARSKPAGDIFAVLAKLPGVRPEEALAICDRPYDIESAAKSGVRTIGLRTGPFDEHALTAACAVTIFDSVEKLLTSLAESPFFNAAA
jgi:HAD superfamily hydrolase (TIGR01509 family)